MPGEPETVDDVKKEDKKEKEEGRVKIKVDKLEIEVETSTRGPMYCLMLAEKILNGFKEDDKGKMFYESQLFKGDKNESGKDSPINTK